MNPVTKWRKDWFPDRLMQENAILPTRTSLMDALELLYADIDRHTSSRPVTGSCAGCGRCCVGPPLYMTCSDLEFEYACAHATRNGRGTEVRFEQAGPDRRHVYRSFTCPWYRLHVGCTVHAARPFACRLFGSYSRVPIPWDFCVFQETSTVCRDEHEIPFFQRYQALLARYPARRGYVLPKLDAYPMPILELLAELPLPWSSVHNPRIGPLF